MKLTVSIIVTYLLIFTPLLSQNMGVKLSAGASPNTTLDVNGAVAYREGTALSLSNGVNSNVSLSENSFFRVTGPTAAFSITGFTGGIDGKVLTVVNATTQTMSLSHQSTSSAANQINTGGSTINVGANGVAFFIYNATLSKWVLSGGQGFTNTAWNLTGNSGTTAGTNFVGTTDGQDLVFKTNNTEGMRLTNTGRYLGLGTNSPSYKLHIEEPGGYDGDIAIRLYNNNTASYFPSLIFQASRGTKSSPSAANTNTVLGVIRYGGYDGSAFSDIYAAEIKGWATENWSTTAHGTKLTFGTIANGSTSISERMVIDHNGNVGIGITSPNQQLEITAAMRMPATTSSTTGVIYKGTSSFIHNYKPTANDGNNTFVGINAGNFTMSSATSWLASGNTGMGYNSLNALTSGGFNTAFGNSSLRANTTGLYNTAIGSYALSDNVSGEGNTAVGDDALRTNTANSNSAVGNSALQANTTGNANTAFGESALFSNTTASFNTAIGQSSMYENLTGAYNVTLGGSSLQSNISGSYNVAIGNVTLLSNISGNNNVGVGYNALNSATSSNNVAIGYQTGLGTTTGNNNTFVGYLTGSTNITGSTLTLLGYQANVSGSGYSNSTGVGNAVSVTASNQVRLGNNSVTSIGGFANWTNVSDGRFKKNIKENVVGLDFILKLRPVTYNLDFSNYEKIIGKKIADTTSLLAKEAMLQTGFIAQEVEATAQALGYDFSGVDKPKNDNDHYGLRYAEFVVPLVKAVQEQQKQIEELKRENEQLKAKNDELAELKASIEKIQKTLNNQQKEIKKLNNKVDGEQVTTLNHK